MREHDGPRAVRRWEGLEFQDLVIPMTVSIRHWRHPNAVSTAAPRVQLIILTALEEAAREGWRADEPTDFATLFSRARVRTTDSFLRWRISSVSIRVSRPISWEPWIPHG